MHCVYILQGGPCPRSCHRMCLDENTQTLYFLGRYTELSSSDKSSSLVSSYKQLMHNMFDELSLVGRVTFTVITLMVVCGRSYPLTQQRKEGQAYLLTTRCSLSLLSLPPLIFIIIKSRCVSVLLPKVFMCLVDVSSLCKFSADLMS